MKVDNTLFQFRKHLKVSTEDGSISGKFRAEIIKKCDKKMNGVQPKVAVEDVGDKLKLVKPKIKSIISQSPLTLLAAQSVSQTISHSTPIQNNSNRWKCTNCPGSFTTQKYLKVHRLRFHGQQISYACPRCHSKFDKRLDYIRHKNADCPCLHPSTSINHRYLNCSLCAPSQAVNIKSWRRHKIRYHIETHFITYKLPHLSLENFKLYCEHVFTVQQAFVKPTRNSENVVVRKCPFCPNVFPELFLLRTHLISDHKDTMATMITESQQDLTLKQVKIRANIPTSATTEHGILDTGATPQLEKDNTVLKYYTCILCQPERSVNIWAKSRHNAEVHTDIMLATVRNPNISDQDFKLYCEHLLNLEIQSFPRLLNEIDGQGRPKIKCGRCWKTFFQKRAIRGHLMLTHKIILKEKLIKLQRNVDISEISGKVKSGTRSVKSKNKKSEPVEKTCNVCGRVLSNEGNLKRHLRAVQFKTVQVEMNRPEVQSETVGNIEVTENNFEQGDVFVTEMDVSSFQSSGVNFGEIAGGIAQIDCGEDYLIVKDQEDHEMKIVLNKDPLEI